VPRNQLPEQEEKRDSRQDGQRCGARKGEIHR
jgi:hypothetical protein